MNDNDIIKVGECIRGEKVLCLSCPYRARFPDCRKYVIRDIFDLASSQKARVEGLINAVKYLNDQLSSTKAGTIKEYETKLLDELKKTEMYNAQQMPTQTKAWVYVAEDVRKAIDKVSKEMGGEG